MIFGISNSQGAKTAPRGTKPMTYKTIDEVHIDLNRGILSWDEAVKKMREIVKNLCSSNPFTNTSVDDEEEEDESLEEECEHYFTHRIRGGGHACNDCGYEMLPDGDGEDD